MTAVDFPLAGVFTDPATTNNVAKEAQEAILAFARQSIPGVGLYNTYTIATGALTPAGTEAVLRVNTESSAASDDLTSIVQTNTKDGQTLIITPADAGRIVTVKHGAGGAGQILLRGDRDLVLDIETYLWLHRVGTNWVEINRTAHIDYDYFATSNSGSANAYTATLNQQPAGYFNGMRVRFSPNADNTSGTVNLNCNGLGNVTVRKRGLGGLVGLGLADLKSGVSYEVIHDGTQFVLTGGFEIGQSSASVASASTLDLSAATGDLVSITGTTNITSVTMNQGQSAWCYFGGSLTITHGASLVCPGGVNLVVAAGTWVSFRRLGSIVYVAAVQPYYDVSKVARLDTVQAWTSAQAGTPVSLAQTTTIAVDLSLGNNFVTTMTGNRTLGAPSNLSPGQSGVIEILQDATGNRTLAFNAAWLFPGGVDPVLSTGANARDLLCYQVNQAGTAVYANLLKAFA